MSEELEVYRPQQALVPLGAEAGTFALAVLSEAEFEQRISQLKTGLDRIQRIQRELMVKDVDYGVIPGTPKPTLYKSGAEKLCNFYRYADSIHSERLVGDGVTAPHITWVTVCRLHLGDTSGPIVAEGTGSCNSWEKKYRYRQAERACPECGAQKTIIKGKDEYERDARYKGGWLCFGKKGGCGAKFVKDDPRVVNQQLGEVDNPDPWDLDNTLLKMSVKRGYVDVALRATATSGLFTQDLEDMERSTGRPLTPTEQGDVAPFENEPSPPPKPRPAPRPQPAPDGPAMMSAAAQSQAAEMKAQGAHPPKRQESPGNVGSGWPADEIQQADPVEMVQRWLDIVGGSEERQLDKPAVHVAEMVRHLTAAKEGGLTAAQTATLCHGLHRLLMGTAWPDGARPEHVMDHRLILAVKAAKEPELAMFRAYLEA